MASWPQSSQEDLVSVEGRTLYSRRSLVAQMLEQVGGSTTRTALALAWLWLPVNDRKATSQSSFLARTAKEGV